MRRVNPTDSLLAQLMVEAARNARRFAAGRSREQLERDSQLLFALAKAVENIGEAASKTSAEFRAQNPEIPWPSVIGIRHRLVHAFHDTDADLLWDTVVDHLPPLIAELERILAEADA